MKINLKMLILMLSCWIGLSAHSKTIEIDGIYYAIISESDRTVEIADKGKQSYDGDIKIPPKIIYNGITYTVISIGDFAFEGCSWLTSVSIPNSVTYIGLHAFDGCSRLTSVSIPNSVTYIGSYAFAGCSRLTSVSIPNSVTSIGGLAFDGCSGLTSVSIPNSVTSIGDRAFYNCPKLTAIIVSEDNKNYADIEGILFDKDLSKLILFPRGNKKTEYSIPSSVTSIDNFAFSGCSGLTSVSIPSSVTSIDNFAFSGCSGLTSVSIPNSVTSIGSYAFSGCSGLTAFYVEKDTALECCKLFSDDTLKNCILYIPKGSRESYESTDPWRNFWNIEEYEFSGVENVSEESDMINVSSKNGEIYINGGKDNSTIEIFSLNGVCLYRGTERRIYGLTNGTYIVRIGDMSTKISI